ncbi:hypothetical protein Pmani_001318 [Petrolisthes manimaculis]|uniref:Uncharacterized protein n=1 Tax=Petrolisthes manimaculis TaxID=1843537 RepID=A0AAE1QKP8_9EUCA|nr:hypothetical protein Pmani_001318 [Petrolisthes manimaculis]
MGGAGRQGVGVGERGRPRVTVQNGQYRSQVSTTLSHSSGGGGVRQAIEQRWLGGRRGFRKYRGCMIQEEEKKDRRGVNVRGSG